MAHAPKGEKKIPPFLWQTHGILELRYRWSRYARVKIPGEPRIIVQHLSINPPKSFFEKRLHSRNVLVKQFDTQKAVLKTKNKLKKRVRANTFLKKRARAARFFKKRAARARFLSNTFFYISPLMTLPIDSSANLLGGLNWNYLPM